MCGHKFTSSFELAVRFEVLHAPRAHLPIDVIGVGLGADLTEVRRFPDYLLMKEPDGISAAQSARVIHPRQASPRIARRAMAHLIAGVSTVLAVGFSGNQTVLETRPTGLELLGRHSLSFASFGLMLKRNSNVVRVLFCAVANVSHLDIGNSDAVGVGVPRAFPRFDVPQRFLFRGREDHGRVADKSADFVEPAPRLRFPNSFFAGCAHRERFRSNRLTN